MYVIYFLIMLLICTGIGGMEVSTTVPVDSDEESLAILPSDIVYVKRIPHRRGQQYIAHLKNNELLVASCIKRGDHTRSITSTLITGRKVSKDLGPEYFYMLKEIANGGTRKPMDCNN